MNSEHTWTCNGALLVRNQIHTISLLKQYSSRMESGYMQLQCCTTTCSCIHCNHCKSTAFIWFHFCYANDTYRYPLGLLCGRMFGVFPLLIHCTSRMTFERQKFNRFFWRRLGDTPLQFNKKLYINNPIENDILSAFNYLYMFKSVMHHMYYLCVHSNQI